MKTTNYCQCGNFLFCIWVLENLTYVPFILKKILLVKQQMVGGKEGGEIEGLEAQIHGSCRYQASKETGDLDSTQKPWFHQAAETDLGIVVKSHQDTESYVKSQSW